jgi:hypothetical protein
VKTAKKTQPGNASDANAAQASSAIATTPSRNRKAKAPSLPFTIELLNRGRAPSEREDDVTFVENWLAVPGAREARCAHRAILKPTDFHELAPGEDGKRCIVVPGSQEGGAALAAATSARLLDFLWLVADDERWATARSHEAINTLAEAAFFTQGALQAVLCAFELANKGPSKEEKPRLDHAIKTASEVVKRLGQSEQFKALLPGRRIGALVKNAHQGKSTGDEVERRFHRSTLPVDQRASRIAMDMKKDWKKGEPWKAIGDRRVRQIIEERKLKEAATKAEIR